MSFLTKILGDSNERYIKSIRPIVEDVNAREQEFRTLTDEELRAKTHEFYRRLFFPVNYPSFFA